MRRSGGGLPVLMLWPAAAAILACLTLGGAVTAAHDAKAEDMAAIDGTRNLFVEVVDLRAMEDLTLEVSALWGFDWPRRVIYAPIDGSMVVLSGQTRMEGPGTQYLSIRVGEPEQDPLFSCLTSFDIRDNEDVWMRVAAPRSWSQPCLVFHLLHHDPAVGPRPEQPSPSPVSDERETWPISTRAQGTARP